MNHSKFTRTDVGNLESSLSFIEADLIKRQTDHDDAPEIRKLLRGQIFMIQRITPMLAKLKSLLPEDCD